jgi:acyl-CoA hydrolase
MAELPAKTVAETATEMVEVVLPNDANPLGNILGGKVMHLIDVAGAISAHRHARSQVVTVAMDHLDFLYPIRVGELIVLQAHLTRSFRTSMEVEVRVYREDYLTGERQQTSSAFVTYVALDSAGKPQEIPALLPRTQEEKRRYREALERRRRRLALAVRAHRRYFEKGGKGVHSPR